jgi:histidine phosphotransferase ChpT
MSELEFASLLCSRLCHDLVSPVGALTNGVEILQDEHDDEMREQVMDLLYKSARQTANKLQFFRLAFGAAGGFSTQLDMREACKVFAAFLEGSRVEQVWDVDIDHAQKRVVKLLLNLAMISADALIRGGTCAVSLREDDKKYHIKVTARGQRLLLVGNVRQALLDELDMDALDPRTAPAYLACEVAKTLGAAIDIDETIAGEISISATVNIKIDSD